MEFKDGNDAKFEEIKKVLIESDWNLKTLSVSSVELGKSINRIRLEFKVHQKSRYMELWRVLIESDWNLKYI